MFIDLDWHGAIQAFFFLWAETMKALVKAVSRIPIREAARSGVSLVAQHVYVLLVHLVRSPICEWRAPFFQSGMLLMNWTIARLTTVVIDQCCEE